MINGTQTNTSATVLRDGNYQVIGNFYNFLLVDGLKGVMTHHGKPLDIMKIEMGDFGEADPEIASTTGKSRYNIKLHYNLRVDMTEYGVVSMDGYKATTKGLMGISTLEWITPEQRSVIEADGDPIEAPPCPYKIQPDNLGKFLWITGAPGLGKSTSAQMLSRNASYVYYEADCFGNCKNPYIPSDVPDPSMAQMQQRNLVGEGLQERREAIGKAEKFKKQVMLGEDYDQEGANAFYGLMCEDIKKERKRIGGDWAIAAVTFKRETRDFIRSRLGPDLVFVVLNMEEKEAKKRVLARHSGDERALKMMMEVNKICDPVAEDEENAVSVAVTDDMTREDVVNKILEMV